MTLFIISKSPFLHTEAANALELVSEGDTILLIHDAVVALKHAPDDFWTALESLAGKKVNLYALEEDCEARGIVSDDALVNYDGFVDLIVSADKVVQ
jgi:sulfur relay protein TusB/DsrH